MPSGTLDDLMTHMACCIIVVSLVCVVQGTPSRAPQERRTPRRFCWFKLPNNNTVFQIDNFYTIPRGE